MKPKSSRQFALPSSAIIFAALAGAIVVGIFGHPIPAAALIWFGWHVYDVRTVESAPPTRLRAIQRTLRWWHTRSKNLPQPPEAATPPAITRRQRPEV